MRNLLFSYSFLYFRCLYRFDHISVALLTLLLTHLFLLENLCLHVNINILFFFFVYSMDNFSCNRYKEPELCTIFFFFKRSTLNYRFAWNFIAMETYSIEKWKHRSFAGFDYWQLFVVFFFLLFLQY